MRGITSLLLGASRTGYDPSPSRKGPLKMHRFASVMVAMAATLIAAADVHASCNLIPGTEKSFSATLGATNRPYAAPGERLELKLRPCDASQGFLPTGDAH